MRNTKTVVRKEHKRKITGVSDAGQQKGARLTEPEAVGREMSEFPQPYTDPEKGPSGIKLEDGVENLLLDHVDCPRTSDQPFVEKKSTSNLDLSLESNDDCHMLRNLPKSNCMEKIVICIDLSKEMEQAKFTLGNGQTFSGVQMMKRTLEIFIQTKHAMDARHQFALVILTDSVVWITDFTSNAKEVCDVLKDLNETSQCDSCDFSTLFTTLIEKTSLPEVKEPELTPPPFVVRAIVIYGRSETEPFIDEENQAFKKLKEWAYFFLDFLYIHPQPSDENKVQDIFDKLCTLDPTESCYVLELTYKPTKMHNKVAILLGHPLQRPAQNSSHYKIQA